MQPDGFEPTESIEKCTVLLSTQPVELYKILKFEGLAPSGAEAKRLIGEGRVLVNGEIELRRRRKIVEHDLIQLDNLQLVMSIGSGE